MSPRTRWGVVTAVAGGVWLAAAFDAAAQTIIMRPYYHRPVVVVPWTPVVVAPTPVVVTPAPVVMGFAQFDVKPRLAEVWVDGAYRGKAMDFEGRPGTLALPVGSHAIEMRCAGHRSVVLQVMVRQGMPVNIDLALEPVVVVKEVPPAVVYRVEPEQAAVVALDLAPLEAAVYVDGMYCGTVKDLRARGHGLLLAPGKHRLDVGCPEYRPWSEEVMLKPREHREFKVQMDAVHHDRDRDHGPR